MEIEKLTGSLEDMFKKAADGARKERHRHVRAHKSKMHVQECNFDIRNYVLRGVVRRGTNKLAVRWIGPKRVDKCSLDHHLELGDLRSDALAIVQGPTCDFSEHQF